MDQRKQKRIFHVNILRKRHNSVAESFLTEEVLEDDDGIDLVAWRDGNDDGEPQLGEHLSSARKAEMRGILQQFSKVLCNEPGRTTIGEHTIDTADALPPYRLLHAYRDTVQEELREGRDY